MRGRGTKLSEHKNKMSGGEKKMNVERVGGTRKTRKRIWNGRSTNRKGRSDDEWEQKNKQREKREK